MAELPDYLEPLPDAETMRGVDRWAIEQRGVASLELMERAGAAVAACVARIAPDGPVAVVCGKGNNGGDGLVAARLLRQAGRRVAVVLAAWPEELQGDARANLERLEGPGPVRLDGEPWGDEEGTGESPIEGVTAVVDALLGTGFSGTPRDEPAVAIAALAKIRAPIVSVDVPSGVDASTGTVAGAAVAAAATVTFHTGKPGLWIHPGKAHAGRVEVVDIGIPRGAPLNAKIGLISERVLALLPRRERDSTKFASGHVLVAGGSVGLTGAPVMSGRAAMRAGAGYVTVLVPAGAQAVVAGSGYLELMSRGLPEVSGAISDAAVEQVLDAAGRGGALALGPGLGRDERTVFFARRLARAAPVPLVLDADGLNAHAGRLQELTHRPAPTVLTPHAGELARLLDTDSDRVQAQRLACAREASFRSEAIVVLKGDDTIVVHPSGRVAVSPGASPALATAGTGDVLTGVLAALLSQDVEPFAAACAGVMMHARAGRLAARAVGAAEGVVAGDVIEALPRARSEDAEGEADG